jgi:serine/threonine protein kinase
MRGTLTEKSDIWSSAVLMTILLTGMSPFKGKYEAETKMNIGTKQLQFEESPLKYLSE